MNTSTEICPSLEDLAAFLDGRLSGDERARVVTHLADCPSCYEVFVEAARYRLDEGEDDEEDEEPPEVAEVPQEPAAVQPPSGKVVPFPRKPVFRWISSIAAALVVVAVGVPLYQQYYATQGLSSQKLVGSGLSGKAVQDEFWSQWTDRGLQDNISIKSDPHELLLGAHLVDLRRSLLRKDRQAADDALARINGHLAELGSRTAKPARFYANAREQLWSGRLPQNFLQQSERMEASLRSEEYPYLDFGKWLEAGRLSALAQDPDFFQAPDNRKFLRAFLHHEVEDLDPEVARALGDIQETLDRTAPSSLPYKDLQEQFEFILKHYQEESRNSDLG